MPAFKDTAGREWLVKIDAPKIREVRQRLEIDLAAHDGKAFDQLAADPVLLVDVLWVLVSDQRTGVSDVEFGQSLGGESLEAAANCLTAAVLDFFRPAQRSLLRSLDDKQRELRQKAASLAIAKINDPELEAKFLQRVEAELSQGLSRMLNGTGASGATSSPASAASARSD